MTIYVPQLPPWLHCNGCGATWLDPDCACTCADGDVRHEEWVKVEPPAPVRMAVVDTRERW